MENMIQRFGDVLSLKNVMLAVIVVASSVLIGSIASTGNPLIVLLVSALFIGVALTARPVLLLWLILAGGLIFSGLAELYLPALRQLRWGVVLAGLALAFVAIVSAMAIRRASSLLDQRDVPALLIYALLFFVISIVSSIVNFGLSLESVIGLKGYFQVWGILLAIYYCHFSSSTVDNYIKALIPLGLLQIPFALHQYFVLVPQRLSQSAAESLIVAPDIVVGTFVGSMGGGGGNAILAVLQVTVIAIVLSLWRKGVFSGTRALVISLLCVIPLLFNETKITFVLLPLVLLIVFRQEVLHRPGRFIGVIAVLLGFLVSLLLVYTVLPRAQSQSNASIGDYVERSVEYNFGQSGYGGLELNRTSVYTFWLSRQSFNEPVQFLIGHGPGSTNKGSSGLLTHSLANDKYPGMGIGLTAFSALLWEVGITGFAFVLLMFWSAYQTAGKLANDGRFDSYHQAIFSGIQAGVVALGLSLAHNNYFIFEIGFQTLLMLVLGYIAFWSNLSSAKSFDMKTLT